MYLKPSNIKIKIGDKVSEGDQILEIATNEKSSSEPKQKEQKTNNEGGQIFRFHILKLRTIPLPKTKRKQNLLPLQKI